eukprot:TRINITY_DN13728_c0_g3_i6.p1 TRINITY_DN13728_c0_g3~~TRINITY_DN13728_c0_g3_i6.p1  ORF type:complete len:335 (-),score=80.30 TRINITY_DN13728_c0_g3_i6:222-1226(-)
MVMTHLACCVIALSMFSVVASLTAHDGAAAALVSRSTGDELLLIQQDLANRRDRRRADHDGFPDLGKLKSVADGIARGRRGLDDAMVAAVDELSAKINKSMDTIDERAAALAKKITVAERRFASSVNATLEEEVSALASLVNRTMIDASELWESTGVELDTLVSVLSKGLLALGQPELASKLTAALATTVDRVGDVTRWIATAREQSTSLALNDAARGLSDLRSTLAEGTGRVEDFVNASGDVFTTLAEGTIKTAEDSLPTAVAKKVEAGMSDVVHRVDTSLENLVSLMANVTSELLKTVDGVSSKVDALGGSAAGTSSGILSKVKRFFRKLFR